MPLQYHQCLPVTECSPVRFKFILYTQLVLKLRPTASRSTFACFISTSPKPKPQINACYSLELSSDRRPTPHRPHLSHPTATPAAVQQPPRVLGSSLRAS
jgi:hypothetical protein